MNYSIEGLQGSGKRTSPDIALNIVAVDSAKCFELIVLLNPLCYDLKVHNMQVEVSLGGK